MIPNTLGVETPYTKSGVNSTKNSQKIQDDEALRAGVDWIQVTFDTKYIHYVKKITSTLLGSGEFLLKGYGIGHYNIAYQHPSGAYIASHLRRPNGKVDTNRSYLQLKGKPLSGLSIKRIWKFLRVLVSKFHVSFTHFDLNIDDHKKRFDIDAMKKAYDEFKVKGFRKTGDYRERGPNGEYGHQFSLGNRGSKGAGKRICCYDKSIESKGQIDAMRLEVNLYGFQAQKAAMMIAKAPLDCFGQIVHSIIVGMVDFRDRRGREDNNIHRRERLPFWKWFADDVPPIVFRKPYKKPDVDKCIKWFETIAPTFFVVMTVIIMRKGLEGFWVWFYEMVFDGEKRATDKHEYLISTA